LSDVLLADLLRLLAPPFFLSELEMPEELLEQK
jgi:hypothetical protein